MCDQIRFFAGAARVLEGKSAGEYMTGYTSFVRREPVGVCAAVTPWNYPAMMAVWKWAPALAAGNTMVLKPSDTTPATTAWMAEVMSEFLPEGVFNVVCGDRETGAALVSHPIPGMVSITGSVRRRHRRRQGRGRPGQARPPRARRQGAGDRVRRRRPRAGGREHRASRATSTPARTAPPPPACSPARASTTTSSPRSSSRPRDTQTGPPDNGDVLYGPLNNANQLAHVSGFLERAPDHANVRPAAAARATRASSSSRPSSTASSRTTT